MQYLIKAYGDYDPTRYGTPWGAPCDSAGRPCFKGKVAHFSGNRGMGGDLFVEDPAQNAVWVYGQKDYRSNRTEKHYVQFWDDTFHPIAATELLTALLASPQVISSDKRRDQLIIGLLKEICLAEKNCVSLSLSSISKKLSLSADELAFYGIRTEEQPSPLT